MCEKLTYLINFFIESKINPKIDLEMSLKI